MQTMIRCTPIACRGAPAPSSLCRCLYRMRLPGCYILTLDACRRYRSAALRYAPRKRRETPLVVYHLRILVLRPTRRLYVPHGLPAAPCPMSTSLLNSDLCTLSACYTLISSPPRPAVPTAMMSRAMKCIASLSPGSHAQATRHASATPLAPSFLIYQSAGRLCLCARLSCSLSNGFATCMTCEIIDAQACLAIAPLTAHHVGKLPAGLGPLVVRRRARRPASGPSQTLNSLLACLRSFPVHTCHLPISI